MKTTKIYYTTDSRFQAEEDLDSSSWTIYEWVKRSDAPSYMTPRFFVKNREEALNKLKTLGEIQIFGK